jgi:TRAP-type C4-dicarboxylate transport system permease small subunit
MKSCDKIIGRLSGAMGAVSIAGVFIIMMVIVVDVFLRFLFNNPIQGSYEIVERCMFCTIFATFAYAQTEKAHIRIDLVVGMFPEKLHMFADFIFLALSASIAAAISYAAVLQAGTSMSSNYITSVLSIPLYPFYWLEFVCMLVFAVTLLYDAVKSLVAMFDERVAESVKAGWSTTNLDLP